MPLAYEGETNFGSMEVLPARELIEEMAYDRILLRKTAEENYERLNVDQKAVFDVAIHAVENQLPKCLFIDAPGGTGKTFVFNTILAAVRSKGRIALAVASSGIASLLLNGGRTAHSRFKIPIAINETSVCSISLQSGLGALLRECHLIIWDEVLICKMIIFHVFKNHYFFSKISIFI